MTPEGSRRADILCRNGSIVDLIEPRSAPRQRNHRPEGDVLDVSGLYVLPGVIDPHVHSRDPGMTDKEDFVYATRAAAAGGVTTILEMPNAAPPVTDADIFRERAAHHSGRAHVDFGLWALALGATNLAGLNTLQTAGAVGAKLFWGFAFDRKTKTLVYDAADTDPARVIPPAGTGEVWALFNAAARTGLLLGIHCEDRSIIEAAGRGIAVRDYEDLVRAHPTEAEASSIAVAIEIARGTGARIHVVHVSSAIGAELIRRGKADGLPVSGETCPHYLTLTAGDYAEIGSALKIFPPVRRESDRLALVAAVNDGTLQSVGSDHAPHSLLDHQRPFAEQPAGAVAVETTVRVLLDLVARGELTLERLTWIVSEGTARLYGLYPQKGALIPGADADFTVVDPSANWRIENAHLHSKTKLSPWHGRVGRGTAVLGILRGEIVMRDGEPVGSPRGRLIVPHERRLP